MKEKLSDKGRTIGYIDRKLNGECMVYDSRNIRIGIIKPNGSKLYAYDKLSRKIGYWDERTDTTYDKNMHKIGKGNLLISLYFME